MATSVCVINVNHRETRHMPNGLKWGFLVALPWLLFMDRPRQHRYRANRDGKEYKEFLVINLIDWNKSRNFLYVSLYCEI